MADEQGQTSDSLNRLWHWLPGPYRAVVLGVLLALAAVVGFLVHTQLRPTMGMKPILSGYEFTFSEGQAAIEALQKAKLTDYKYDGVKLWVPVHKETVYLAALGQNNALPGDFSKVLDDNVKNVNILRSAAESERAFQAAKQKMLSEIISAFPEVLRASVVVDLPQRTGLRRTQPGSASVTIFTKGGKRLDAKRIEQVRRLVAHAYQGLPADQVYVGGDVDLYAAEGSDRIDTEYLRVKNSYAQTIEGQLLRLFPHLEGVNVVVNVEVDPHKNVKVNRNFIEKGPPGSTETTTRATEASRGGGGPRGEPGTRTNVDPPGQAASNQQVSVDAPKDTSNDETAHTVFENIKERRDFEIESYVPTKVGVVINVPTVYLADGQAAGDAKDGPKVNKQEIVDAVTGLGFAGIKAEMVKVVGIALPPKPTAPTPAMTDTAVAVMRDYGSTAVMVVMAGFALLMALSIAKKSGGGATAAAAVGGKVMQAGTESTAAGGVVGNGQANGAPQASNADGTPANLLPNVERSKEDMKFEQLQARVGDLIKQSPEMSASLVKRWISASQ